MNNKIVLSALLLFSVSSFSAFADVDNISTLVKDSVITAKIYTNYTDNDQLNMQDIDVTTDESGNVKLVGVVKTDDQRDEAIKIARDIDGVTDVDSSDLITTDSQQPFSDAWITTKATVVLFKEDLLSGIDIETKNGAVYLSGSSTDQQASKAIDKVKNLDMVKNVVDQIDRK